MDGGTADELGPLIERVRSCSACANYLPLGPRPVLQLSKSATLLIASQAPGTKAHASGIPFSDASGDQLRRWMGISDEQFYDAARVAIVPMALCYPGRASGGGDAPPRPECSTLWRGRCSHSSLTCSSPYSSGPTHRNMCSVQEGWPTACVTSIDTFPATFPCRTRRGGREGG